MNDYSDLENIVNMCLNSSRNVLLKKIMYHLFYGRPFSFKNFKTFGKMNG